MKLAGTSSLLSILYSDTMDVYRYTKSINEDGTTEPRMSPSKLFENVPCLLSFSNSIDNPEDVQVDGNPIDYQPRIFCSPSVSLKAGDYVEVSRKDDSGNTILVYKGNIGMPAWYTNHQEIKINIEEHA